MTPFKIITFKTSFVSPKAIESYEQIKLSVSCGVGWPSGALYFLESGVRDMEPPKAFPCQGVWGHSSPTKCLKLRSSEIRFTAFYVQVSVLRVCLTEPPSSARALLQCIPPNQRNIAQTTNKVTCFMLPGTKLSWFQGEQPDHKQVKRSNRELVIRQLVYHRCLEHKDPKDP